MINLRQDVFVDIFPVSSLVVKGDPTRRQRFETDPDVYLGPTTSYADV
jgi:hypothetical protein